MAQIVPVILCGGSGTRLWPASRASFPKQFHNVTGDHTLVQETARRVLSISNATDLLSVTHDSLLETLAVQIDAMALPANHHILLEPSARNTAAAIAYAALYIEKNLGGGILWAVASDHVMTKESALSQALETAVAAAQNGRLVTFGIQPDRPEPGLGYIRTGAPMSAVPAAHNVEEFVEKPTMDVAVQYVASGDYLWNSGMFVMDAATFLAALRRHAPDIDTATRRAFDTATIKDDVCSLQETAYGAIPKAPVDKAVMEKEADIAVVPCDLGWSDVGSWQSLWDISPKDADGNVSSGDVLVSGATNSYFRSGRRLIAAAGVDNIAVVETGDAILVAGIGTHQPIRDLIAVLQENKRPETEAPLRAHYAWGARECLKDGPDYTLHEMAISPNATLQAPREWWSATTQLSLASGGDVTVTADGQSHQLSAGQSVTVDPGQGVTIEGGDQPAVLLALTTAP